jgi:hypothetical protein
MRKVTVTQSFREAGSVPMIRLRGKWLKLAGFEKGRLIRVDVSLGKLTLTRADETAADTRTSC